MNRRNSKIIFIGLVTLTFVIASFVSLNLFKRNDSELFRESLDSLVVKSQELTKKNQTEIGKWLKKQYDNATMASITDSYIPKFKQLVYESKRIQSPQNYTIILDSYTKSIKAEIGSYIHFRNYLNTGSKIENETSSDLLTRAYQYEKIYSDFLFQGSK